MKNNVEKLVESRWNKVQEERNSLVRDWGVFVNAADEYVKASRGEGLTLLEKHNIAVCCENALSTAKANSGQGLFETTDSSAISFLGVQLPIISAILPLTKKMAA